MDCQYPLKTLSVAKKEQNEKRKMGKNLEGDEDKNLKRKKPPLLMAKKGKSLKETVTSSLPAPYCLPCPQLSVDKDNILVLKAGKIPRPSLTLKKEQLTYPVPLFEPFVAHCGQGPDPKNVLNPLQHSRRMLKNNLKHESRFVMKSRKNVSIKTIVTSWEWKKSKTFDENFPSLSHTVRKYGDDFKTAHEEAKFGGNLCSVQLNNKETYLIHSTLGDDGDIRSNSPISLYFSRVTRTDAMADTLMDLGQGVRIKNGRIYQITTSRHSFHQNNHDIVFGTRQKHSSRLWKVGEENGREPVIQLLHETTDERSTVRSISVHPLASSHGEYCELRSGKLTAYRDGSLYYEKDVDKNFRYCLYQRDQPSQVLLTSNTHVSVLDSRSPSLLPIMSMQNQMLQNHWNVPSGEHILSFSPSSRPHINFVTTETSVLLWDHRFGSRFLSKMAPFLEHSPKLLTSIKQSTDEEWVFYESQTPYSSGMLAFKWSEESWLTRSTTNSLSTASVLMLPVARKTIGDTIRHLQKTEVWSVDWTLQNRFQQHVTGLTSNFDEDNGTIQIWNSTAAGDIFVQHLDRTKNLEESQITSDGFKSKMKEWSEKVMEQPTKPEPMIEAQEILQNPYLRKEMGKALIKKRNHNINTQNIFFNDPENLPSGNLIRTCPDDHVVLSDTTPRSCNFLREWKGEPPLDPIPDEVASAYARLSTALSLTTNEEPSTRNTTGFFPDRTMLSGDDIDEGPAFQPSAPQSIFPDFLMMGGDDSFDEDSADHFTSTPAESAIPPIPNFATPSTSAAKQQPFSRNALLASSTPYARFLAERKQNW